MPISNALMNAVAVYIRRVMEVSKTRAKTGRIRDNLEMVDAHKVGSDSVKAGIKVSLLAAPEAAAYEHGSGLHDPTSPHLIPIAARNAPNLVFWWANRSKWFVGPKLPYGHPGVAKHSCMLSSLVDNVPYLEREIDAYVRQEIDQIIIDNNRVR